MTTQLPRDSWEDHSLLHKYSDDGSGTLTGWHYAFICSLFSFIVALSVAVGLAWGVVVAPDGCVLSHSSQQHRGSVPLGCYEQMMQDAASVGHGSEPFFLESGQVGHKFPEMYGHVQEKTIWSFWYDEDHCPLSTQCTVPPYLDLCMDTVRKHKGSFEYRILHMDTISKFVNLAELPLHWHDLTFTQKTETLMNALMARYGGIALDPATILFRSFDEQWNDMVFNGYTFRGFFYRLNGKPWPMPESTATWFYMSRREGLFTTAVTLQRSSMCHVYEYPGYTLGDHILTPTLSMFNYSLPKCYEDGSVREKAACPELTLPDWAKGGLLARNDRRIALTDPRSGPHLPFAHIASLKFSLWHVSNTSRLTEALAEGSPSMQDEMVWCSSMRDCWENIFRARQRYGLTFVKLFDVDALTRMSRKELLSDKGTYFFNWIQLAGLNSTQLTI